MTEKKKNPPDASKPVTLKILAEYLDLSPATVSIVLNNSPVAKSISQATHQRVQAAAKKFDYRPNLHARMLRTRLTNTIGVIVPELSEGYFTGVMLGVEEYLMQEGFLYFTVSHLGRPDLIEEYPDLLMNRAVDGFLTVNTELHHKISVPAISISAHSQIPGVTNATCSITTALQRWPSVISTISATVASPS
jgi:DNA-binding LacI/PurR family transcriptional regulator